MNGTISSTIQIMMKLPKAIKQAADANVEEKHISIAQIMNFQIHICGKY